MDHLEEGHSPLEDIGDGVLGRNPHHHIHVGHAEVRVEEDRLASAPRKGKREVDGDVGLPDTPLPARDHDGATRTYPGLRHWQRYPGREAIVLYLRCSRLSQKGVDLLSCHGPLLGGERL
ncbi:hypothetical protein D3C87_1657290 [compost metagenome]